MFTPVGSLLKTLPRRSKIPDAILAIHVRRIAKESLAKVCGDLPSDVLATAKIVSFKNGVLTMSASSLLATELQMRSGGLIREINRVLGKKIVERLRFRVG